MGREEIAFRSGVRLTGAGVRDLAGSLAGREPHLIPIVGPPGTLAAINSPDQVDYVERHL